MKKYILNFIFILIVNGIYCQAKFDYQTVNFDFIGYINNQPIYQFYPARDPVVEYKRDVYYIPKLNSDNEIISFTKYNKGDENAILVYNNISFKYSKKNLYKIVNGHEYSSELTARLNRNVAYSTFDDVLFFSLREGKEQRIVKAERELNNIILLPLFGHSLFISENWLYFSSIHKCERYSDYPVDIYRVKLGDWNNPELILADVITNEWFMIPESNVFYAKIYLKGQKDKAILYNVDTKSYSIIDRLPCNKVIKYEGKQYYEIRTRNSPIYYKPVEIPSEFPYKDERDLCNLEERIIINMSNKEKPFPNTFITEELLYNSTNKELSELTKEELRLLRNAFFARQGYQFKSKDLQDFFDQFEWYHKMVERNKYLEISNEDVVIAPIDKERVELILEIENSK